VYDADAGVMSNPLTLGPPARHFHVEAGYDANGQPVVNLFSQDPAADPATAAGSLFSVIRVASGQVAAFDVYGNAIP
jgi:hypothetical protein